MKTNNSLISPMGKTIGSRISVPDGYERIAVKKSSYSWYLRNYSLQPNGTKVRCYNGKLKRPANVYTAVLKMDIGNKNLQQCADSAMRLRADFLYSQKRYSKIHFNLLGENKTVYYKDWADSSYSYESLRKYLDYVYAYANTASLKEEMEKVNINNIKIGDVFVKAGTLHHAEIVVDVAIDKRTGKRIFLLAQGYSPAQDVHILLNFNNKNLSPWYSSDFNVLKTPQFNFSRDDLRRFKD
jgi:hypothetical protein